MNEPKKAPERGMNLREVFAMTMKARFRDRKGDSFMRLIRIGPDGKYLDKMIEGNFKSFIDGWLTRAEYDAQISEKIDLLTDQAGLVDNAKKQIAIAIRNNTGGVK